jgi:hypothetical protein
MFDLANWINKIPLIWIPDSKKFALISFSFNSKIPSKPTLELPLFAHTLKIPQNHTQTLN